MPHRSYLAFAYLGSIALVLAGCSSEPSPGQVVLDRVKASNTDAEWFPHVTDWDAALIADFGVATDYDTADPSLYAPAVEVCEAIMAEVAPEARDDVLARVYGVETTTEIEVDGSQQVSRDEEMMAQYSTVYGSASCGATPPRDIQDAVAALGVPLF